MSNPVSRYTNKDDIDFSVEASTIEFIFKRYFIKPSSLHEFNFLFKYKNIYAPSNIYKTCIISFKVVLVQYLLIFYGRTYVIYDLY